MAHKAGPALRPDRGATGHPGGRNSWEPLRAFPILSFAALLSSGWRFSQQEMRNCPACAVLTHGPLKKAAVIQSGGKMLRLEPLL